MSSGGKRANGWHEMARQYTHNIVPEPPVVTKWQKLLAAIHMGEEDALMAANMPGSMAARALRDGLKEKGLYRKHFVPEPILQAFGWQEEVEARITGEWANAQGSRDAKDKRDKRASLPLLEKVQP